MTEKFVYIEHKGADYILDTPNWELDFIEMLGDTLEAEEIVDLLNEQNETIQQQKEAIGHLSYDCEYLKNNFEDKCKENEELKQRNNRQAKQLDRLYNLIEEKDWRTLTDIIDDFKRCEEQLQREWKCYDD